MASLHYACRGMFAQNRIAAILLGGGVASCAAAGAWSYASVMALQAVNRDLASLSLARPLRSPIAAPDGRLKLDEFSSTRLLSQIHAAAGQAGLTLDAVDLALDDNAAMPYLRYRASFALTTRYPTVRRFAALVLASSQDIELDAINCVKAELNAVDVVCDITLSAFYRKGEHG